jgi:hypothetical protein
MASKSKLFTTGNLKVPFYVINFGSATDCPSKALGLCQIPDKCYAYKAERMYRDVLPFRRRQAAFWQSADSIALAGLAIDLETTAKRARKATLRKRVLRFSEAGDFADQTMVDKFVQFITILRQLNPKWSVYGYTARLDLDLSRLIAAARVNLSLYSRDLSQVTNRFLPVIEPSGDNYVCRGNCRLCAVCRKATGKTIEVVIH